LKYRVKSHILRVGVERINGGWRLERLLTKSWGREDQWRKEVREVTF
jgi:hypothetical protein